MDLAEWWGEGGSAQQYGTQQPNENRQPHVLAQGAKQIGHLPQAGVFRGLLQDHMLVNIQFSVQTHTRVLQGEFAQSCWFKTKYLLVIAIGACRSERVVTV